MPLLPWRPVVLTFVGAVLATTASAAEPTWRAPSVPQGTPQLSAPVRSVLVPLALGGVLSALAYSSENPDRAAQTLDHLGLASDLDPLGSGWFFAAGVAGSAAYGLATSDAAAVDLAQDLALAGALSTTAVYGLKVTVGRSRPDGGRHSFPSGHTALAFAGAPILTEQFGWRVGLPAYVLASLVAVGRMEDRRHYLSDVLAGAAIGVAAGTLVANRRAGIRLDLERQGVAITASW